MDVKFGQISQRSFGVSHSSINSDVSSNGNNIFSSATNLPAAQKVEEQQVQSGSRLNDLDSNILENNAYQDISDEVLKIEKKIDINEKELAKITQEIETLESFEDSVQLSDLIERKKILEKEIESLNKKYSELGLGAKISGQIASAVRFTAKKKSSFSSKTKKIIIKGLTKISKKFNCSQNVKDALETLSNINSDVDELVKLNVPYGEKLIRYERLTAYLNRANVIHSQISKDLKVLKK